MEPGSVPNICHIASRLLTKSFGRMLVAPERSQYGRADVSVSLQEDASSDGQLQRFTDEPESSRESRRHSISLARK